MLPKIIDWVTEVELVDYIKRYNSMANSFCSNRKEIKSIYPFANECDFDEWHEDALTQELVKHKYIICGDTHQHLCIPVFSDGYLLLSMRRWAEVMDNAYTHINPTKYPDPWFYMAATCAVKENLPDE